jgi:hypothetical protein
VNLYRTLDTEYRHLRRQGVPEHWRLDVPSIDALVETIRTDSPCSDQLLGRLIELAGRDQRAVVVAAYALVPLLRARLGRTVTDEYRSDALTELTIVLLDAPTVGTHLARRLVNRAHTRVHKAARRVTHRGVVNLVEITPTDPDLLARRRDLAHDDLADDVAARVDLARFGNAVADAVDAGALSPVLWDAFRDHRIRRALDTTTPACSAVQRKLASRASARLRPLVDEYLHAA